MSASIDEFLNGDLGCPAGRSADGMVISHEAMTRAIRGLCAYADGNCYGDLALGGDSWPYTTEGLTDLGLTLYDLNLSALGWSDDTIPHGDYRYYGIGHANHTAKVYRYPDTPCQPVNWFRGSAMDLARATDWLKALDLLIHRCTGSCIPETDLYRDLQQYRDGLAVRIVRSTRVYVNAPWN